MPVNPSEALRAWFLGPRAVEWKASGPDGLVVLRSTVMDPFLDSPTTGADHVAGYARALARACHAALG